MATAKVPAVSTISSLIRRFLLLSSSMLMYSSVSLMYSPAHPPHHASVTGFVCDTVFFHKSTCASLALLLPGAGSEEVVSAMLRGWGVRAYCRADRWRSHGQEAGGGGVDLCNL